MPMALPTQWVNMYNRVIPTLQIRNMRIMPACMML